MFSNISIFSAVSFLLNHQVGLSCDSLNSAPKGICCRAACICCLINVTNKSFLYFKGTQFTFKGTMCVQMVHTSSGCTIEFGSEAKQGQSLYWHRETVNQYHAILEERFCLTEPKTCLFMAWHCSFILAECSALGKQTAPASVRRPKVATPVGTAPCHRENLPFHGILPVTDGARGREAFHSCPLSDCIDQQGRLLCWEAEALQLLGLKAGREYCREYYREYCREYCRECSPSCPWLLQRVNAHAGFAQTPLETPAWGLSLSLPRNLNADEWVWGGVLVALRLKVGHVQCMLPFCQVTPAGKAFLCLHPRKSPDIPLSLLITLWVITAQ